jgi:hypothetical protein
VGVAEKERIMKMLTIVCGERVDDEVRVLFNDLALKSYTVISHVGGSGQTGVVSGTGGWTDRNKLYLIALDEQHMTLLVNAVRELHVRLVQEHSGLEVPLKVFLQPCELIV